MPQAYSDFQEVVWDYYRHHGRDMPWRHSAPDGSFDPYKIMVSEIMLQQTQVSRVIPKYQAFIKKFPNVKRLADAELADVLGEWSGLGYNRRAKYLHQASKYITNQEKSKFPETLNTLSNLPGVGEHTAGAIMVYAYNQPIAFLETNIRTVYIHHFFADHPDLVSDKQLLPLVVDTIDRENPREWFWALMDYGSYLKTAVGNLSRQSKHYTKQSTFKGSKRQIRGQVIQLLVSKPQSEAALAKVIPDSRLADVLNDLQAEGLITKHNKQYRLA